MPLADLQLQDLRTLLSGGQSPGSACFLIQTSTIRRKEIKIVIITTIIIVFSLHAHPWLLRFGSGHALILIIMVGLFSKFSSSRAGHRRSQSAMDEREMVPPNREIVDSTTTASTHGIQVSLEFKPIEHPVEPLDNDQPVKCPLPEPSILNDGRIWKERLSARVRRSSDLPVMKDGAHLESEGSTAPKSRTRRVVLPSSVSAPEHNILTLLEECNAAAD